MVNGLNKLEYLNVLPIYIDSWIRLSQKEYTSNYPLKNVEQICSEEATELVGIIEEEKEYVVEEEEEPEPEIVEEGEDIFVEQEEGESDLDEYKNQYLMDDSSGGGPKKEKKEKPTKKEQKESSIKGNKEDIHNIDGMSLSHPYFFQQRMEDRAKTLFTSIKGDKFKSYSRMCPSSIRRQPVILTKEELADAQKQYPGEYSSPDDVLEYSSNKDDPNNPESYYYVCPRYWCLKTNSVISEEDVKAGKCGKVLPADATKVIPGHYVYEFSSPEEHVDEKGNYIKHFPGFHKNATEDNKCIPCCYKKVTDKQKERRAQCEGVVENPETDFSLKPTSKDKPLQGEQSDSSFKHGIKQSERQVPLEENYILGAEKFPLGVGRWGKLPISIQHFFKDVGAECKVNKQNKNKSSCLLRHGVEKNINKSFLACVIDALYYAEYNSNKEPLPILDVNTFIEEKLLKAFDLDSFLYYQNGTLYDSFADKTQKLKPFSSVDKKYKTTKLYLKSQGEDIKNQQFFMNVLNAYERFCDFLKDEKSYVDYTYLWDLICKPNPSLFVSGLNLVILNIPDSDATINVEFVCPTNHYSKEVYDSRRRTLILLSREDMFEPVYEYKDIETKIVVTKTFSEYDRYLSPGMHSVITQVIKPLVREHCSPSKLKTYQYKQPEMLDDLIKTLNARKYRIMYQVRNLRGKVVGILAKDPKGITGFLPCYPTSINTNLTKDFVYTNDDIWETYANTLQFLNRWYKIKKVIKRAEKEKCSPNDEFCKVVEGGVIVGFLTNTNQFIQISDPVPNHIVDYLPQIENDNYLLADNSIAVPSNEYDMNRIMYSKKIKLENNFYSAFRSAVRILLNDYANLSTQQMLLQEITGTKELALYSDTLKKVVDLLKMLTKSRIRFIDEVDIDEKDIMTSCLSLEKDKCVSNPTCFYSKENCGLNLPRMNLLSPEIDNKELYYLRLADELIRYHRIKTFIFQRKNYLLFETLGYNLRYNEMIILESLITQQYFEKLIPSKQNLRLMNGYDTANPIGQRKKELTIDQIKEIYHDDEVSIVPDRLPKLKYLALRDCFPTKSVQIMYPSLVNATFQFARDIVRQTTKIELSSNDIRDKLAELYRNYTDRYKIQIADILIQQGKKTFGSYVKSGTLLVENMIYTEGYYLTNFDLWLLLDHYQIPSCLVSHKVLLETNYNLKEFALYVNEKDPLSEYVFIVSSAIKIETPPSYGYIEFEGKTSLSVEDDLKDFCKDAIFTAISDPVSIEEYVATFKLILTTNYVKKQPGELEMRQEQFEQEIKDDSDEQLQYEPINISKNLEIPNLTATPNSAIKLKTKRNRKPKIAENIHKPHTKKKVSKKDASS
jgi:hypothetical protein